MSSSPEKVKAELLADSNGNPVGIILIPAVEDGKRFLRRRYDAFYQRSRGCFTAFGCDGEYLIVNGNRLSFTTSGSEFAFVGLATDLSEMISTLIVPSGRLGLVIKPENGWCAFLDPGGNLKIVGPVCISAFVDGLKVK